MALKGFQCKFSGSFQCRLATDAAPTNASPTGPATAGAIDMNGWTYDYGEPSFDRIIRLSKPVALRDGLIDAWKDNVVTEVSLDHGKGLKPVTKDALLSAIISIGSSAMFDATAGGGPGKEAVVGFEFSIGADQKGGPVLIGQPSAKVSCLTDFNGDKGKSKTYETVKSQRVTTLKSSLRKAHVSVAQIRGIYGFFYALSANITATLKTPSISGKAVGALLEAKKHMTPAKPGSWSVNITVSEFDGDTLVGKMDGALLATF